MGRPSVSVDEIRILHVRADGSEISIPWDELDAVSLEITEKDPQGDDLFWILEAGGVRHRISSETPGAGPLMRAFQALPDFDFESLIDVSTMLEPGLFECWRKCKP